MSTIRKWSIGVALIVTLWLLAGFGLLANWLAFMTGLAVIAALATGAIRYYLLQPTSRQALVSEFQIYWWLWAPAMGLALITTLLIAVARYCGWVIPVLHWGGRGTPWLYLYFWQLFGWGVVVVVVAGFFHHPIAGQIANAIGNWIRCGGFWKFWSTDNMPANSLVILWVILLFVTVIAGPPTTKIDPLMTVWEAQQKTEETLNRPALIGMKEEIGNFFSQFLVGRDVFGSEPVEVKLLKEKPLPRYERGWALILLVIHTSPLAFFGLMFSRRDGFADWLEARVEQIKAHKAKKKEPSSVAAGGEEGKKSVVEKIVGGDTAFSKLLASDLLSDTLVTAMSMLTTALRKHKVA